MAALGALTVGCRQVFKRGPGLYCGPGSSLTANYRPHSSGQPYSTLHAAAAATRPVSYSSAFPTTRYKESGETEEEKCGGESSFVSTDTTGAMGSPVTPLNY